MRRSDGTGYTFMEFGGHGWQHENGGMGRQDERTEMIDRYWTA